MKKVDLPKWAKSIKVWLAFALLVGGGYAALANTIPDFPRWTWLSEHKALVETHEDDIDAVELTHETDNLVLAGRIKDNEVRALEGKVRYLRREAIGLRNIQRQLKMKGQHDPRLQKDIEVIEYDLKDTENVLERKRGN